MVSPAGRQRHEQPLQAPQASAHTRRAVVSHIHRSERGLFCTIFSKFVRKIEEQRVIVLKKWVKFTDVLGEIYHTKIHIYSILSSIFAA